ncbi:hypothetical protein HOY82DRAFT_31714 [Tuber indicum]|nr:hypothetical protein HOY82DRAFT_31714 [Tuber indicum]
MRSGTSKTGRQKNASQETPLSRRFPIHSTQVPVNQIHPSHKGTIAGLRPNQKIGHHDTTPPSYKYEY